MTKSCSACKIAKPIDSFWKKNTAKDGHSPRCIACSSLSPEYRRAANQKNRYKLKTRYSVLKHAAKSTGRELSISFEQFSELLTNPCFYCEFPLDANSGYALDRMDSLGGYSLDNVVPCCSVCNYMKSGTWTPEEFKEVGKVVRQLRLARQAANKSAPKIHLRLGRNGTS